MKLGEVCKIDVNMTEADFWLQRTGSLRTVGTPHKNVDLDDIGIKITREDILVPDYIFYWFMAMQQQGVMGQLAVGSIQKTLTIKSISEITLAPLT